MLEKLLEAILSLTIAINNNTAAKSAPTVTAELPAPALPDEPKKPKGKAKADTPPVTPPPEVTAPTVQDVRTAATALMDANGNDDGGLFAKINAKHGTKRISEVPEAVRAEVIAEINAKLAEVTAAKASGASAI